jgi:hypothetical protein
MTVKRMDNVGIVVEDLDAAIGFVTGEAMRLQIVLDSAAHHISTWIIAVIAGLLVAATGCSQQGLLETFAPKEEVAIAKRLLAQLSAGELEVVERQLDAKLQGPQLRGTLALVAAQFPRGEPTGITIAGAQWHSGPGFTQYNLSLEYEYPESTLLANVVIERREGGEVSVLGVHVNPKARVLKEANRFTFAGRAPRHYVFFALVIAIPLFIVYALYRLYRTPVRRRKWLWYVFVSMAFSRSR